MYRNICFGKIKFPRGAISDDGKQFVKGLLNRNPRHRLGAHNDAADLKAQPFFKDVDWYALLHKQIPPVFKPLVESDESVANFDPEFTNTNLREVAKFAVFDDEDDEDANLPLNVPVREAPRKDKGVAIKSSSRDSDEPLSSSVQEKFRGFSYSGTYESSVSALESGLSAIDWGQRSESDRASRSELE